MPEKNRPLTGDTRTPPPAVPIAGMTEEEYRRLINHFLWLIVDEAEPLRVFGQEEVEHAGGRTTSWGPWPQGDCAAVLLRWFDAKLLALYGSSGALPHQEARDLLSTSEVWAEVLSHPSEPYLAATAEGAARPDEDWYALVRDLLDRR